MKDKDLIKELKLEQGFSEVVALSKEIPKSGDIIPAKAAILEVKFWQVKTKLTNMVTIAKRYELGKKQERDNALIDIGSEEDAPNSKAGKDHHAQSDDRWRKLQKETKQAEVLREFIENKRQDFEQAIYVMRSIQSMEQRDRKSMPSQEV